MMRFLLAVVFAIGFLVSVTVFSQEKPDLNGGGIEERGTCVFYGNEYECLLVHKDTNRYIIMRDRWGEFRIYLILFIPYNGELDLEHEVSLLWVRDLI